MNISVCYDNDYNVINSYLAFHFSFFCDNTISIRCIFLFCLGRAYGLMKGKDDAGLMVAVKTLNKGSSTETKEYFIEKLALMSLLHHENIVELLAVSTEEEPYGMIFEYMQLGDLAQYLRRAGPFHEGDEREKG